jgi:hypothetical protein
MSAKLSFHVKRLGILLVIIALIAGMGGCIFGPSSQGIQIRTWHDLHNIRNDMSSDYVLMNDLDSSTAGYDELAGPASTTIIGDNEGTGWHPIIGPGGDPPFTGTFNGQGYEIRDIFIDLPDVGYVGLFSIIGEEGHVLNVGVVNADITSTAYIGGIAGGNAGTVSNSYSTGSVAGDYMVGGVAGVNSGTVTNSYSRSDITSGTGAGGLAGQNFGTISSSYSAGSVTGTNYTGGLVGYNEGTVSGSFWDTETSGQATSAGGTGKTTAEIQHITTFLEAGWNIIGVADPGTPDLSYTWNIVNEQTYPFLSWES